MKKGRYHTFGVVNAPSGLELIRMSTESRTDAERWIHALRAAGCEERQLTRESGIREPLRAADVRWVRTALYLMRGSTPPEHPATAAVLLNHCSKGLLCDLWKVKHPMVAVAPGLWVTQIC